MEVIATGRITTYAGTRPNTSWSSRRWRSPGQGALLKLIEDRKRKKLAAEGLFDAARKKKLPLLPDVIGIVTSPTGAVIRDILHRLADRFPRTVLLWPVAVQGEARRGADRRRHRRLQRLKPGGAVPRPDVLIVARGGGSLEDLMAFNEEVVVRAAAASEIPLISAVGHETDTTLIDYRRGRARADADRGGRDGGAGAGRPDDQCCRVRASFHRCDGTLALLAARAARRSRARATIRAGCCRNSRSGSTIAGNGSMRRAASRWRGAANG